MSRSPSRRWALLALIAIAISAALAPAPAGAEIGPELVRFGEYGSGAGQLDTRGLGGIAADPDTGHIFVTEFGNDRISEFTAWGQFVKAWGWGVRDGTAELQTCTEETGCQQGLVGSGAGQISAPSGIALDPGGDIFVFESAPSTSGQRIQKFSADGEFLWMAGGEVNKTTGEDICTQADLEAGDLCGKGLTGTGPGEFSRVESGPTWRDVIDVGPDNRLYVADSNRIQIFDLDGSYEGELAFATIHASDPLFSEDPKPNPGGLAIDPLSGDFVIGFPTITNSIPGPSSVWRVSQAGAVLEPAPLFSSFPSASEQLFTEAVATDATGDAYVVLDPATESGSPSSNPRVRQLDAAGTQIGECCVTPGSISAGATELFALATNTVTAAGGVDLYVAHHVRGYGGHSHPTEDFIEVVGTPPDKWPPPEVPPSIEAQSAKSVGEESAGLAATINPNFWADTHYRLEYGTAPCAEGGCQASSERQLGAGIVKKPIDTPGVQLSGLQPGTTYHYRFRAESGGGGPVFGPDRTFTTFAAPAPANTACPNQAFRSGPSAALPDCRAYELVSPLDKSGGELSVSTNQQNLLARLDQAATDGEAVTYSSSRSFADNQAAPYTSQYLARRAPEGWQTQGISPPRYAGMFNGLFVDSDYKGFSEDLSSGWVVQQADPPLTPEAVAGYPNLYRRDDASGSYEALSTVEPPSTIPTNYNIELQGASADASRTFFGANGKLTASSNGSTANYQLYEAFKGKVRLVSVKPDGSASTAQASAGSPATVVKNNRESNVETAVSEDGTRIYWSETTGAERIYVRLNAVKTVAVSAGAAKFWAATPDGGRAIYAEGGALKVFDLGSESSSTLVGEGVQGLVGASEDLTRVYLVSTAALAGGAQAGKPNLYLYEEGQPLILVATLSSADVGVSFEPSPTALSPLLHLARVSADGAVAVFMSRASLSGADNTDQVSKQADAEVFRYEAAGGELACVSCSPKGQAPIGRELQISPEEQSDYWYASRIPGWEFQLHAPRVLSAGGNRVFFDSLNRLVAADTNGLEDVYQWEAPGTGTCTESAPAYSAPNGGCLDLISSGRGSKDSEFLDASADGRDAFFLTEQSLVAWDPAQIDLYDARAGGGLPAPPQPAPACEGEACQGQVALPPEPGLASQSFEGAGNVRPAQRRCRRGFVRRKGRCVRRPCRPGFVRRKGRCLKKQGRKHRSRHHRKRQGRRTTRRRNR